MDKLLPKKKGGRSNGPLRRAGFKRHKSEKVMMKNKSVTKCKPINGFITSSDRVYSWRVAPQHCSLPLDPVNKCKALSGLTKKCKFVSGLLTKLCKLFSGRVRLIKIHLTFKDGHIEKVTTERLGRLGVEITHV